VLPTNQRTLEVELEGIWSKNYSLIDDGLQKIKGRQYIPYMSDLKKVMQQAHAI